MMPSGIAYKCSTKRIVGRRLKLSRIVDETEGYRRDQSKEKCVYERDSLQLALKSESRSHTFFLITGNRFGLSFSFHHAVNHSFSFSWSSSLSFAHELQLRERDEGHD